jgi:hypothetical protein
MSRRALTVVLVWGVAIGCGGGSGGGGTGGAGGHGGAGTGTGGHAGSGGSGGHGGSAGAGGGTGATAGAAGGNAGAAGGAAGGSAGAAGGTAGAAGGTAGAAGGAAGAAGAAGGHAGGNGGAAGGTAGAAGGMAGGGGTAAGGVGGGTAGAGGADPVVARGEYLVKSVLGCTGCHGANLAGRDSFVSSGSDSLSSANLTSDATGLKNLTDQAVKDAITKGQDPDEAGKYLFANMPYYQFANLSDADTTAIVAYLRTVPAVAHEPAANTGKYATQPSSPENAAVDPASLPAAGSATGAANGKYLATLVCVSCHTVDLANSSPLVIDATKAFQGGRLVSSGGTAPVQVETSNLTPDASGIMGWSAADVATAVQTDKNKSGTTICGMRGLTNMTTSDATDIGTYLTTIPAVSHTITMHCP